MNTKDKPISLDKVKCSKLDRDLIYYIEINNEFKKDLIEAQASIDALYKKKTRLENENFYKIFLKFFQKKYTNSIHKNHA